MLRISLECSMWALGVSWWPNHEFFFCLQEELLPITSYAFRDWKTLALSPAIAFGRLDHSNTSRSLWSSMSLSLMCELSHWWSGLLLGDTALADELCFLLERLSRSSWGRSHTLGPISWTLHLLILLKWQGYNLFAPNCAMSFQSRKREV